MLDCRLGRVSSLFILLAFVCVPAQAVVVLQYHHISEHTPKATSISPELFRLHMRHLNEAGYTVLPLPKITEALTTGRALPDKTIAITFDDGYESVYTEAFPILKEKAWPFTVFVNTRPLETGIPGFVSWDQLNEMAKHGASIANHSHTHTHFLRREPKETDRQWRARIKNDIQTAQQIIQQRTGQNHKLLAYPYGEYDRAVEALVEELGFVAFGQQSGPIADNTEKHVDLQALSRFPFGGVYGDKDDFTTKVATLAMPIQSVTVLADRNGPTLPDTVLPQAVGKPVLQITLRNDLTAPVQCFASGQGAIPVDTQGQHIQTQAQKTLPIGRSRYNCTAASGQPGRFYWYSQFFIRKQADGSWYPEP